MKFLIPLGLLLVCANAATFLQVSDIHYDNMYLAGSANNCFLGSTGMGCCRQNQIPLEPYSPASPWGDYNCDAPMKLVNGILQWTSQQLQTPQFILWSGDNIDHHDLSQTYASNMNEFGSVASAIKSFFPKSKVFAVLGNHDVSPPVDQLYPNFSDTQESANLTHLLSSLGWLDSDALNTFAYGGYYSVQLTDNVLLICINSLYYDSNNLLIIGTPDPSGQWEWLETMVESAQLGNQTVFLMGHIPPKTSEAGYNFTQKLVSLVTKYNRTIVNQFWGHTHEDQFKIILGETGYPVGQMYIVPSVVPSDRFPAIREYVYDEATMEILDYNQYHCNLTQIIATNEFQCYLAYNAKSAYGLNDMSPASWYQLYERMTNDTILLTQYWNFYNPGFNDSCDAGCKQGLLDEIMMR